MSRNSALRRPRRWPVRLGKGRLKLLKCDTNCSGKNREQAPNTCRTGEV